MLATSVSLAGTPLDDVDWYGIVDSLNLKGGLLVMSRLCLLVDS